MVIGNIGNSHGLSPSDAWVHEPIMAEAFGANVADVTKDVGSALAASS